MDRLTELLPLLVIAAVPLGYAVWIGAALRRSPYTIDQSLVFFGNVLLTRLLWRAEVPARLPVPNDRGAVLIANHRSSVDPFFIQLAARRRVHWMVAAEYATNPIIAWLYRYTQTIPASRSGRDTAATKRAIDLAAGGGLVGLFPEGRVNTTERPLLECRPGAVAIAVKAGVPIVPVHLTGSPYAGTALSPFLMTARVRVRFGEPIETIGWSETIDDRQVLAERTRDVLRAVVRLGGDSTFEPTLSGRAGGTAVPR